MKTMKNFMISILCFIIIYIIVGVFIVIGTQNTWSRLDVPEGTVIHDVSTDFVMGKLVLYEKPDGTILTQSINQIALLKKNGTFYVAGDTIKISEYNFK